ncbi:MAG: TraR/DksA family transcriptional regulator [Gammaproteobacteria bacterium]
MALGQQELETIRNQLLAEKAKLGERVEKIHDHARNPLDADSAEQAAQIGNLAVVSQLESEAIDEISEIDAALQRIDSGHYGICAECGDPIDAERLLARPEANECFDCAELADRR